jgi:hypothetical protein
MVRRKCTDHGLLLHRKAVCISQRPQTRRLASSQDKENQVLELRRNTPAFPKYSADVDALALRSDDLKASAYIPVTDLKKKIFFLKIGFCD